MGALALGASIFVTAQFAGAAPGLRQGGVFRYGAAGASVQIDPQVAYVTTAWWLEYATAAKLFDYPDRAGTAGTRLVPQVASRFTVSRDGRTYTFFLRKGFRFSDGSPVTAGSFAYAIDRLANHDLASPGAQFVTDRSGTNIVGARAVSEGRARHVRGVAAKGNRLTVRLTRRDQTFLAKLAMPFFQATSTKLPLSREVVGAYPSAGPYFFSRNDPDVRTELRRNPFWRRGAGRSRPRNLGGLDVRWNLDEQAAFRQVLDGELDEGPLPRADVRGVAARFGVNRSRFWVEPSPCVGLAAFNGARALFRNNAALRRALNWAVDRRAAAAAMGPYAATPWTHLLSPAVPGSITAGKRQPYSPVPNLRKARALAAGHLRSGRITVGYRSYATFGAAQAQLVREALIHLGFKSGNITMKAFSGADLYEAMWKRPSDLDVGVAIGWCANVFDPSEVLELFLSTASPLSYDNAEYRRTLSAAKRLTGSARLRALGELDLALTKELAPAAVLDVYDSRFLFSDRVDPRSLVFQRAYSDWSIPALALK